jgi:hypothetical protein
VDRISDLPDHLLEDILRRAASAAPAPPPAPASSPDAGSACGGASPSFPSATSQPTPSPPRSPRSPAKSSPSSTSAPATLASRWRAWRRCSTPPRVSHGEARSFQLSCMDSLRTATFPSSCSCHASGEPSRLQSMFGWWWLMAGAGLF